MITVDDYLDHWRIHYYQAEVPDDELTDDMRKDAKVTVDLANELLERFGDERGIASGWRPVEVNRLIKGAATHSNHCLCRAIDLVDSGNRLDAWISGDPAILDEIGLWRESPNKTAGWVHIQIVPYKSWLPGKSRTFQP